MSDIAPWDKKHVHIYYDKIWVDGFVTKRISASLHSSERHPPPSRSDGGGPSYTGCYELTLGRWWPWAFGEDTKYVTPPNRIELSADVGTEGFGKGHLLIRRVPLQKFMVSEGRASSFWEVGPGNRVNLSWTDGFTGVTLDLKKEGHDLSGWAHPHFDSPSVIPHIARVKAKLIPCR